MTEDNVVPIDAFFRHNSNGRFDREDGEPIAVDQVLSSEDYDALHGWDDDLAMKVKDYRPGQRWSNHGVLSFKSFS